MKKLLLLTGVFITSVLFTGCSKDENAGGVTDYSIESLTHSDDQARFSEEMDILDDEASNLVEDNTIAFDGIVGGIDSLRLCGASISRDTLNGFRRLIINYNGTNCGGRVRTGTVILSMLTGQRWVDSGAVLRMNIQNLQITRLRDTFTITVNGQKSIKNVTGGRLRQLSAAGIIVHTVTSPGMSIAFPNGSTRSWQIARRRTFSDNGNGLVTTLSGMYNNATTTNITEWGTDRFGTAFVSATPTPIVRRQSCNFRITNGQARHERGSNITTVDFGLDAQGVAISSCPNGPLYMRITHIGPNGTRTVLRPY